jgi:hypothetical protein
MPTISQFFGISVRLYYADHPPPHVHAVYQDFEAKLAIDTAEVIEGRLPAPVLRIVRDWMRLRRGEVMENWRRARADMPLERIPGADVG